MTVGSFSIRMIVSTSSGGRGRSAGAKLERIPQADGSPLEIASNLA
jgi:hypothetical protein